MDINTILKQIEDYLFPSLNMTIRERSIYYHFFRHTHVVGKDTSLFGIASLAKKQGIAESSVREIVRAMHDKGCIIINRSRHGHTIRVLLPGEIDGIIPQQESKKEVNIETIDFFTDRLYVDALVERESGRCFYCLRKIDTENCELDHATPRVHGADNSYRNIVASCHECNSTKQGKHAGDFVRSLYRSWSFVSV